MQDDATQEAEADAEEVEEQGLTRDDPEVPEPEMLPAELSDDAGEMLFPDVVFGFNSINLPEDMSPERWQSMGDVLVKIGSGYQWWFGRWINFGMERFEDLAEQIVDGLGFDFETINTWRRVDERIPEAERLDPGQFSWTVHKYAAELPTKKLQRRALKAAEREGFSTRGMQDYCKQLKASLERPDEDEEGNDERARQNTAWESVKLEADGAAQDAIHELMNEVETFIREACGERGIEQPLITRSGRDS